MPEGKHHDIERSHSKRWSKTSICEIGNYFWDNPIKYDFVLRKEIWFNNTDFVGSTIVFYFYKEKRMFECSKEYFSFF